jgi:hypothetical protein
MTRSWIAGATRPWIAALAALALAGCGSDAQLDSGTADGLHRDVAAVRAAAQAGDRAAALAALDRLSAEVRGAQQAGEIADADARTLRTSIGRARRRIEQDIAAPTPAPTPTATPAPPLKPKHGKSKKHGKHGEEGGD